MWPYVQMWFPLLSIALTAAICFGVPNYRASASSSAATPRSVKRKIVPPPGLGATVICPPWASMIVREIDSPTPMPCRFVVTNG
jgi:hypothetical protein